MFQVHFDYAFETLRYKSVINIIKSDKTPFIIYLECVIEKIDGCKNNLESSSSTKVGECILSDFSMSTIS